MSALFKHPDASETDEKAFLTPPPLGALPLPGRR